MSIRMNSWTHIKNASQNKLSSSKLKTTAVEGLTKEQSVDSETKIDESKQLSSAEKIAKFKELYGGLKSEKYHLLFVEVLRELGELWANFKDKQHKITEYEDHIREQIGNTMYVRPLGVPKEDLKDGDFLVIEYPAPADEFTSVKDGKRYFDPIKWEKAWKKAFHKRVTGRDIGEDFFKTEIPSKKSNPKMDAEEMLKNLQTETQNRISTGLTSIKKITEQAFNEDFEKAFLVTHKPADAIDDIEQNSLWFVPNQQYKGLVNGASYNWTNSKIEIENGKAVNPILMHQNKLKAQALQRLTKIANGEVDGRFFSGENSFQINNFLQEIGVNTQKDFSINGKKFWFDKQNNLAWE